MNRNVFSRLGSAILLCALALQLCCPAFAEDNTVYLNDNNDLIALAERCAYDAWSKGKTVILQRDISLGGVEFLPIANFGGTFEGNGHTISGMNITASVSPAGLFGTVAATGVVRDLTVEGSVAPGGSADVAGGLAGRNSGVIESCTFTGTVEGEKRVGGLVGENTATGVIRRCTVNGGVFGKNMTGGVAGENHGTVSGSVNRAYVNTNTLDPSIAFDKLDLSLSSGLDSLMSPDTYNVTVDSGGVAGFSDGELLGCRNYGSVGYQHIGYNVGGIAGRSSGHVATCTNEGRVYGRREVGGVVGMAEPYIKLDLREGSIEQVRRELNALANTIDKTVDDAEGGSATVSARLTAINQGIDDAETHARTLTDRMADLYDSTVAEIDRGSEILGNAIHQLDNVTKDMIAVSEDVTAAIGDIESALQTMENYQVYDNLSATVSSLRAASADLRDGAQEMRAGLQAAEAILDSGFDPVNDAEDLGAAIGQIGDGLEKAAAAYEDIEAAEQTFNRAMEGIEAASGQLKSAFDKLYTASGELTTALRDAERLLSYLDAQEDLHFEQLGPETDAEAGALYDSLRGISNNLELLNQEAKSASDVVLEDVRQINRQFTTLMNTLLDVVEDVEGMSPSTVVEDTSDEDVDAVISGKVLLCSNMGVVNGDIDVGGVAGAMMVYNELDPENDDDTLSSAFHKRYELKCILQDCVNSGAVTGKRDNVGSVCGSATLGVISDCEGYGSAASEGGDYVGGVAGYADNIVRKCWAKSTLSGVKYIGGIVGSGGAEGSNLRVEGCRTLVEIAESTQYAGAIAGFEAGTFSDNCFVSDALAGIDRVSYQGRAEPIDYEELLAETGVPREFRRFTLSFVADEKTIRTLSFAYGDSFDASAFPEIPPVDGQFAHWDREDLSDLRFDTTVTAVYAPRLTALASAMMRSAARPAFFVEGAFDDTASFDAAPAIFDFDTAQEAPWRILRAYRREIQEQWELTLPDDGAKTHIVRYLAPEDAPDRLELYALTADGWQRLETENMGSYLMFETAEHTLGLTVVSAATPWWVGALVAVFLLGVAALLAALLIRRRPKKIPQTEEEQAKAALGKKKQKRLRIILLAAVLVLGAAVGAAVRLAPRISDSMGLYMLLRNYAERSDLDMELSLSARVDGEAFDTTVPLFTAECGGKRVSCVMWEDIPICFCDGAMVLENGRAYRADGVLADYSQLLTHAASLYRAVDVAVTEENGVKRYHAATAGSEAEQVLETLLPGITDLLSETATVTLDVVVTDGELTSVLVDWDGADDRLTAELSMLDSSGAHALPQAVRSTIASGGCADAAEIGSALRRLLLAWTEAASRDPLTADVTLAANCGPLLVDELLTWQRTNRYGTELSSLSRRGSVLYYTDEAACTDGGFAVGRSNAEYTGTAELLRLAYEAFLLGETDCVETGNGWRYTVVLDAEAMAEFAALIAPETRTLELTSREGTIWLDLTADDMISSIYLQERGSVRVVRTDISAAFSARLLFDRDAAFRQPSADVLSALGVLE